MYDFVSIILLDRRQIVPCIEPNFSTLTNYVYMKEKTC